jgi:hypothetical protein
MRSCLSETGKRLDVKYPNLITENVFTDENPPAHEQGTDRPGRAFKRAATNRRSSVEITDWHELEKHLQST